MKQKNSVSDVTLNLLGTIIGAGIFGLPAVMAKTGILAGSLLFSAVLVIAVLLHLLYAQVVLGDKVRRRLAGYADHWVGRWAYWLALTITFLKIGGAVLAYLILGGEFLAVLAQGWGLSFPIWIWQIVFWLVGSAIVFFGLRIVTNIEDEMTWLLISAILFSGVVLFPFFDWQKVTLWHTQGWGQALGVMFFTVTAMTVIPESVEIAARKPGQAKRGIILGTVLAGVLSWIFGVTIALAYPQVAGASDIPRAFPPIFWWLIPIIGLFAVSTSYITLTQALKNMLHLDAHVTPWVAWFLSVTVPLVFFALTSRDFLSTVGFVGGVFTGLTGLMVCALAWSSLRRKGGKASVFWRWIPLPMGIVMLAIVLQVVSYYVKL